MIEVKNIEKSYGKLRALKNASLRLEDNKIYGLLGRNGAGKTTLLNIISGRIFADGGEVLLDGEPVVENDHALGQIYLTGEKTLYPENMRVKDALKWSKEFYPDFDVAYAERVAKQFGLGLGKKIKSLSTGYASIFKLVVALSVNTPYLIFDEPVLGLDANNRELFYQLLLEKFSNNPCTVIISTHLVEEVAAVIDEIVIIKEGVIIRNESCEALLAKGYTVSGTAAKVEAFIAGKNVIGADTLGGLKTAYIFGELTGDIPEGIEVAKLSLQKLYIQLTNHKEENGYES